MILFKCACGAGLKVDDDQAGKASVCPICGKEIINPANSDENCVLIYQDGGSFDGRVMTIDELEEKIKSGVFHYWDLVWSEGHWTPLGKFYDLKELPMPEENSELVEIALSASELPALDGYKKKVPSSEVQTDQKKKKPGMWRQLKTGGGFKKMSGRQKIVLIFKILAVLAILGFGIYRGFKMMNFISSESASCQSCPALPK